jgi:hypothetical protein
MPTNLFLGLPKLALAQQLSTPAGSFFVFPSLSNLAVTDVKKTF